MDFVVGRSQRVTSATDRGSSQATPIEARILHVRPPRRRRDGRDSDQPDICEPPARPRPTRRAPRCWCCWCPRPTSFRTTSETGATGSSCALPSAESAGFPSKRGRSAAGPARRASCERPSPVLQSYHARSPGCSPSAARCSRSRGGERTRRGVESASGTPRRPEPRKYHRDLK